jgi:hypothetical protein
MSGENAFLAMVIFGFLAFMVTLAYGSMVTWQMDRLERSKSPVRDEHREAA